MHQTNSNRNGSPEAPSGQGPSVSVPVFVELDPEEAAEYGAFRDDVELEDVLEAGDLPDAEHGGRDRGT